MLHLNYFTLGLITSFSILLGFILRLILDKKEVSMVFIHPFFIDILKIDKGPTEFSVEVFQQMIVREGLAHAIIYYEDFFLKDFSVFPFTREQLREISKTFIVSGKIFPTFLRLRAIGLIARSVTSLSEAVEEYNILSPCKCSDGKETLIKMVTKRIESCADCDYVIKNSKEFEVIITTSKLLKDIFLKKNALPGA